MYTQPKEKYANVFYGVHACFAFYVWVFPTCCRVASGIAEHSGHQSPPVFAKLVE